MILGERSYGSSVHVPPWSFWPENDPVSFPLSPSANGGGGVSVDDYALFFHGDALQRYLPSNTEDDVVGGFIFSDLDKINGDGDFFSVDAHTCDNFRMFDFKVKKCTRGRSHDWTECPFAHPGEKAQRRDPKKFHYSGTACPDFRRGSCCKGDSCEFAHGVFECWLHPARYRTQPCKDGMNCKRRVCFFAHSSDQLRVLSPRADFYDGAPHRFPFMSAPESDSPPVESPPMSPMTSNSVNEVVASLRRLQLSKLNSVPNSWANGSSSPRFDMTRPVFFSLPNTPTRPVARPGIGYFDSWENAGGELEPVMERVESGRDLRAKMFEKLSKENPLERVDPDPNLNPDFGWVSEVLN